MKTCHECGALVEDNELICPECGATVVKRTEGFSLKEQEPVKKRTNPMGTPVSTGSGLTDILRGEDDGYVDDEGFGGGSIPMSMTRTDIHGDYSPKKKSGSLIGLIVKFVLLIAVIYGIYALVTHVTNKQEGATKAEQVLDYYVEAINEVDKDKLLLIIPPYITTNIDYAETMLDSMRNIHYDTYDILSVTQCDDSDIIGYQDTIKLQTGKTANIKEACVVSVRLDGTTLNSAGVKVNKHVETEMTYIKIRSRWYLYIDTKDFSE